MASSSPDRRRDRHNENDSEVEQDYGPESSGAKRQKVFDEHDLESTPASLSRANHAYRGRRARQLVHGTDDHDSEHKPGAIVRVQLRNFVTYENAVFYPGPHLNMVIGPNGTGKSSLVCAICLGLGYSPKHLGRAGQVGEFVKHGQPTATIEIELKGKANERRNHIVKVRITRDGDKRKYWLNDGETTQKAVQQLMRTFGIQVDNLCQFLPQDRVAEFAGLSSVELLHETQRAAAPEEMLAWHDQLKELRKDEKMLQLQHRTDTETVANLQERQENLRGDVERLQERAAIQAKIEELEKMRPIIEYNTARKETFAAKTAKQNAEQKLKTLERSVAPLMSAVNDKQKYHDRVGVVLQERKQAVQDAERAADHAVSELTRVQESIEELDSSRRAEIMGDRNRKQTIQNIMTKIRGLKADLQNEPPPFDGPSFNAQIREQEHLVRDKRVECLDVERQISEQSARGLQLRNEIKSLEQQLVSLDSQAGKQLNKLRVLSKHTAEAWEWCKTHMDEFEKTVFGPALLSCSVKNPAYVDSIESLLQRGDFLCITAQTKHDYRKLSEQFFKVMRLADVSVRVITNSLDNERYRPPISGDAMGRLGFDCWALDQLEGPEPVLAMLCNECFVFKTGIALKDSTSAQFSQIEQSDVQSWVTGGVSYRITRRKEYGAAATSTMTKNIGRARFWTDQPVDVQEKRDLQDKIRDLQEQFDALKEENGVSKRRHAELKNEIVAADAAQKVIRDNKNEAQRAAGQYAALPGRLSSEEEALASRRAEGDEHRARLLAFEISHDDLALQKADLARKHGTLVAELRTAHEELLDAETRHLEAASDVDTLKTQNAGIARRVDEERKNAREFKTIYEDLRAKGRRLLEVCTALMSSEGNDFLQSIDPDLTVPQLEADIAAEKDKLEVIHGGNSGALVEFERRAAELERLSTKVEQATQRLARMAGKITEVRERWEPQLDKLIAEISRAFAHNFEQIGCAGEVGVHKDEDFDQWAIEIKVKFRETESLQLLNAHRQSGGERSVSTIFYLMSLQSLARAPFRVVDEINQGMDPRNERMVHGRMVEIACQEHTSQYFLITPKLLTNLTYDERMKVLLICSGEHMPPDHKKMNLSSVLETRRGMISAGA